MPGRLRRARRPAGAESVEGSATDLPEGATVHKILCICAPGTLPEIQAAVREAFPALAVTASSDTYLEINNAAVSKAKAVRALCLHRGIPIEETLAFGDNYNDLDMLKTAGLGIAMGNAPEEIRRACPKTTLDCDHDGVAAALAQYLKP